MLLNTPKFIKLNYIALLFAAFCLLSVNNSKAQKSGYSKITSNTSQGVKSAVQQKANSDPKILLPVEVLGDEGTIESRTLTLTAEQVARIDRLWLQINNIGYENKASVKINSGGWTDLNHAVVEIQSPEKERGGMAHGGHSTIRFSLPISGFVAGSNTIQFRFNTSDAISNGYRVVRFNLWDNTKAKILPESDFVEDDPMTWKSPYYDTVNEEEPADLADKIALGKNYWYNANLVSNYLQPGEKGFWYGYELPGQAPINAKCASCHTQDGRDLEIFAYSNKSIIERSKFHMLTEEEGKLIATYIRSLSDEHDNVGRYGRPWNPPYQPGPEIANRPIEQWAAGAGLDAVLEKDSDMLPYMFPNGVDQAKVYDRFDSDKMVDRTILPIAIQFPDWKHWLPMVHPMDAYTKDDYWNNPLPFAGNQSNIHPKQGYIDFRNYLEAMPPVNRDPSDLMQKNRDFWYHYRFFLAQRHDGDSSLAGHWREPNGWATQKLADGIPREFAATSLARLMGVQFFEIMNEFDLQDKAHWFVDPVDQPGDRQWFGENYQIFEIPPHFQACVSEAELPINDGYDITGNCLFFHGQSEETGAFESTNWYHLQLIVNGGNGMVKHNSPMDYNYHPDFIMKASGTSGVYEPLRYYHSLNAMYQFRSWTGGPNPNDGRGFRIRVQGPWHIIGRTDSNQLNGFSPSVWPTFLDRVEQGMSRWVLNAQLRQFLTEVQKPGNDLANWNRTANGGSNELDAESKTTAQLIDMTNYVGLYYWADKMYYLFPEFKKLGVDCQILEEMLDWSEEAWPNIDWSPFRDQGELQLDLLTEPGNDCNSIAKEIVAQTANEGDNPIYQWWVDGQQIAEDSEVLDVSEIREGALVKCRVTSSKDCIANGWVETETLVPGPKFEIAASKNGGDWESSENIVACLDDTMEFKVELALEDPLIWLDAMDVSNNGTTPSNGSAVTRWYNKSDSGFTLSNQSNSSLRPTYNQTGMNGLPALQFGLNDADGLMLFPTNNDSMLNGDWTMVVVAKYFVTNDGDWNAVVGNEAGDAGFAFYIDRRDNGGRTRTKINGSQQYANSYESGTDFVLTLTKEGGKIKVYMNGLLETEVTASSANIETSKAFYLGQRDGGNANASWYHRGPISEVLFYDRLISNDKINYLEGYLMHKWNFDNDLPNEHLYKESSPLYANLHTPDGQTLVIDKNVSSHTITFDSNAKFGTYTFTSDQSLCEDANPKISIVNSGILQSDDLVKHSIDDGAFHTGAQIDITTGSSLELLPNYELNGDFQWEQPNGSLLTLNQNPAKFTVSLADDEAVWKLHVKQDLASCIANDKEYAITLQVADLPEGQKDDDEDGVMNDVDQCPNSIEGAIVNANGCFELPLNSFNIQTRKESCPNENDGSISIYAANTFDYTLTVNNAQTYNFTNNISLSDLPPGDYDLCITVAGAPTYEQCFTENVGAANQISGKAVKTKKGNVVTENITITSGSAPYIITVNGKDRLITASRKIAVDVNHGDKISIHSKIGCEGELTTEVDLIEYFAVYPNPTNGDVQVTVPNTGLKEVTASIYNSLHQKYSEGTYTVLDGKIQMSLSGLPMGVYFIKLELESPVNLKIVKQ